MKLGLGLDSGCFKLKIDDKFDVIIKNSKINEHQLIHLSSLYLDSLGEFTVFYHQLLGKLYRDI